MPDQRTSQRQAAHLPSRAAGANRVSLPAVQTLVGSDVAFLAGPTRPTPQLVPCRDAVGRARTIQIRQHGAGVTLGLPPGESAALTRAAARQLAELLGADRG